MAKKRVRTITDVVREMIAMLPEAEEFESHGLPHFRVRGKTFGNYTINHHGDGRVALNLLAPSGMQKFYTKMDPEIYFVPAYTGPKGWLGIQLDQGLDWQTVFEHAREAYAMVAPPTLVDEVDTEAKVKRPTRKFRPEEIDPFKGKSAKATLKLLDKICTGFPESQQALQFGTPVWKAGKKTFAWAYFRDGRFKVSVWVGAARQRTLTKDKRFQIPAYTGHNGWIDLDIEAKQDWEEIEQLVSQSYRHFALKRMLKALDQA